MAYEGESVRGELGSASIEMISGCRRDVAAEWSNFGSYEKEQKSDEGFCSFF